MCRAGDKVSQLSVGRSGLLPSPNRIRCLASPTYINGKNNRAWHVVLIMHARAIFVSLFLLVG